MIETSCAGCDDAIKILSLSEERLCDDCRKVPADQDDNGHGDCYICRTVRYRAERASHGLIAVAPGHNED